MRRVLPILEALENNASGDVIPFPCSYYGRNLTLCLPSELKKLLSLASIGTHRDFN